MMRKKIMQKNDILELNITGMTSEGNGVGKHETMVVFVPLSAVGDKLRVKIVKVQKTFAYGIIEKIIEPSQDRIESDCPVFGKCGGCTFRHINYNSELEIKNTFIKDAFKRIGGINTEIEEIIPCENIDYYRNKAQYPVVNQDGKVVCGFYAQRSHRVIPFSSCKLQPVIFAEIVDDVVNYVNENNIKAYNESDGSGILRHIYIRKGQYSNEIMLCLVVTQKKSVEKFKSLFAKLLEKYPDIKSIVLNVNKKNTNVILGEKTHYIHGERCISDLMCGNKVLINPLSFYQVNTKQAERLYNTAKEYLQLGKDDFLLDLYCGTGTIGLSMAKDVRKMIGVEIVKEAIDDAVINAEANNISNAEFICGDAGEISLKLNENNQKPDALIIDPPRKGCETSTLEAIIKMSPKKIAMISCNPATAARDCKILCENGYEVKRIRGCDLFARTGHVETVVLMSKKC